MKSNSLFLSLALLLLSLSAHANWQRSIANYARKDYHAGTQNWKIAQHPNGWMYFANNKGLLEFDGVNWTCYPMNENKTRALCIGEDQRIYIGGMGELGYFVANPLGGLDYHCLSDSLPGGKKINVIWNVLAVEDQIYFQADREIYYKGSNDSIQLIPSSRTIRHSALIDGKLYIADTQGLSVVNGRQLQALPHTQRIGSCKVIALLPLKGQVLVVTSQDGLFLYNGQSIEPYHTAADDFLANNQLFCATTNQRTLVLGSIQNGVLLLHLNENRIEKISTDNGGLQNKTILSAAFDRDENLWLGLDNGIDYVRLRSTAFPLFGNKPVIGSGYSSCVYQNKLYLGTNQGLYSTDYTTRHNADLHVEPIPSISGQVWNLSVHDNRLFCASNNGVFILSPTGIERLSDLLGAWEVIETGQPDRLLTGTYQGLYLLTKQAGKWTNSGRLHGFYHSCNKLFMEDSHTIWVANKGDGIFRITLSADLTQIVQCKNYNNERIPKNKGVYITAIDREMVIATYDGLYRYNQLKDQLEPYEELEQRLQGKAYYRLLEKGEDQSLWYVTDETLYQRYPKDSLNLPNKGYAWLRHSLIDGFEHIHLLDSTHLIAGTEEGFTLLTDLRQTSREVREQHLHIRKVYSIGRQDSLLYGRSYTYADTTLVLPYSHNSLRIVCSADGYRYADHNFYAYRLKGEKDEAWSTYTESNVKEYSDLREGNYVFQVCLLNHAGPPTVLSSLSIRILPPWYRSIWMYLVYLATWILLLLYLYIRISARHREVILRQQQEMERQQEAFEQENLRKEQKISSLEQQSLQMELKHKTEELVRTTLNIVRKNEILQEIKKEASNIQRAAKEDNRVNVQRGALRLISSIETNLEHDDDIKTFETAFDSVHHDFFKHLDSRFPTLNKKEKMLCAYIKMDLMSKEIAPLLNISLRGVEIARYRLRKKLELEEGTNLAEFLQKLT